MKKIIIKQVNGTSHEFPAFESKEENYIKVNLNDDGKANGEGIWAVVDDMTKIEHDENKGSGYFAARLRNHALYFYPLPSWGLTILCKHNGNNRPIANINWVDYSLPENRHWDDLVPVDVREQWMKSPESLQN